MMSTSSGPSVTRKKSAASSTVRASGPKWEMVSKTVLTMSIGIRPSEGFKPTIPQKAAGMRTEPPISVPSAKGTQPLATAAPEPPEEPPAHLLGSQGLTVSPQSGLRVKLE